MTDDDPFGMDAFNAEHWTQPYYSRSFQGWNRKDVYIRDKAKCRYCGKRVWFKDGEVDHVHPWRAGGATSLENGAWCCVPCNRRKAHTLDKEAPIDVAALFFRKVHRFGSMGPENWGGYAKISKEVQQVFRNTIRRRRLPSRATP